MQKNQNLPQTSPQIYMRMPQQFSKVKKIAIAQVWQSEFIIAFDKDNLYVSPLIQTNQIAHINIKQTQQGSLTKTFQTSTSQANCFLQVFAIPNIKQIQIIARNFLLITTQSNYIGLFTLALTKKQSQTTSKLENQTGANISTTYTKVQFNVVMQWVLHKSYFIREVIDNIFQVQIFVNDNQLIVYQFTTKNKIGKMSFTMNVNGKIKNSEKNQIYGSKCFINLNRKALYTLKNFGDKNFIITPILFNGKIQIGSAKNLTVYNQISPQQSNLIGFFGLKQQEYYAVYSNMTVISCTNPSNNHTIIQKQEQNSNFFRQVYNPKQSKLQIQKNPYSQVVKISEKSEQLIKYSQFLDYLKIQDHQNGKLFVYQIKFKNSILIDCQFWKSDETWKWFFGWGKKLIGLNYSKKLIKFIKISNQLKLKDLEYKMKQAKVEPIQIKSQQKLQKKQDKTKINNEINSEEKLQNKKIKKQNDKNTQQNRNQEQNRKVEKQQTENKDKQQQNLSANKFKPMKIIQRNKTSVSKTLQKSKQNQPLESQSKIQRNTQNQTNKITTPTNQQKEQYQQNTSNSKNMSKNQKQNPNFQNKKEQNNLNTQDQKNNQSIGSINTSNSKNKQEQKPLQSKTKIINQNQNKSEKSILKYRQGEMLSQDSDFTQEQIQQFEQKTQNLQKNQGEKIQKKNEVQTKINHQVQQNSISKQEKTKKTIQNQQIKEENSFQLQTKSKNENLKFSSKKNIQKQKSSNVKKLIQNTQQNNEEEDQIQNKLVSSLLEDQSEDQKQRQKNASKIEQSDKNHDSAFNLSLKNSFKSEVNKKQDMKIVFSTTINRNNIFGIEKQQKQSSNLQKQKHSQEKNFPKQEKYPITVSDQALDNIFKVKSLDQKSDYVIPNIFSNKSQKNMQFQNLKGDNNKVETKRYNPFKFNNFNLFPKNQNIPVVAPNAPKLNMPIPTTNIFGQNNNLFKNNLFAKDNKLTTAGLSNQGSAVVKNNLQSQIKQKVKPQKQKQPDLQKNPLLSQKQYEYQNKKNSHQGVFNQQKLNKKIQEINDYIKKFQICLIGCIQQSEKNVLKKVQQIPQTHNPYNKSSSLVFPNQIKQELLNQLKAEVKKWMIQEMFKKIQLSFKQIMQDHKGVYDKALQYYASQAKKKISSLQLQFQQQTIMLNQMQLIANNMKASLQNIILQGQQMHTFQLKQFKKQMNKSTQSLQEISGYINNQRFLKQKQERNRKYESTLTELRCLKQILIEKQKKKQEKKLKRQQQKLQIQSEKAQKQRLRLKKQKKLIQQKMNKDNQKKKQRKNSLKIKEQQSKERKKLNKTLHV